MPNTSIAPIAPAVSSSGLTCPSPLKAPACQPLRPIASAVIAPMHQNNGYILQNLLKVQYHRRHTQAQNGLQGVVAINTLSDTGRPQFIHSGTYEELIEAFGLAPSRIADAIASALKQ